MRLNPGLQRFVKKNSATILTYVGIAGIIGTAVVTSKATIKANAVLEAAKKEKGEDLTTLEKINCALPSYIPVIMLGVSTVSCILGANVINKRYQASLLSAYSMLDYSFKEYRSKVNEIYGEEADETIEKAIQNDKCPRRR